MATVQPYRIQLAALLALLYLFIVTPVQYWHRHEPAVCAASPVAQHDMPELEPTDAAANCTVCSHSYAASSNDAVTIVSTANFFHTVPDSFYLLVLLADCGNACNNKSPPAACRFVS